MDRQNKKLQLPIKNTMFYSEEDYGFESELIEGYLEEDINQTIVLYEVDREKTNINAIYKDSTSGNIRYKAPKEIPCMYEIKESEIKNFDKSTATGVYTQDGNLTIYVLVSILEKYNADIKRGDYVGVQLDTNRMRYYSVVNDGKVNSANTLLVGNYKPTWRVIDCALVSDISEFNG